MTIKALMTRQTDAGLTTALETVADNDLGAGNVTVRVEWSTVNYKDGLALAGARIMQTLPMIGGIDLAGTVETSEDPRFSAGDKVLVNGWELSQTHNGGYAQKARVPGDWLIKVPAAFSTRDTMAIGTAGYTAMLCILALEHGGLQPSSGKVLVTGASGGVGSVAITMLSEMGYSVIASTGRMEEADYLRGLGASEVIERKTLSEPGAPIGAPRWSGVVDSVGSHTLANALAQTDYRGVVAACGLAQGMDIPGSVLPFILRNVTLAGIDSVNTPMASRQQAWSRLAAQMDPAKLNAATREIVLDDVPRVAADILAGKVRGRTVVRIG